LSFAVSHRADHSASKALLSAHDRISHANRDAFDVLEALDVFEALGALETIEPSLFSALMQQFC